MRRGLAALGVIGLVLTLLYVYAVYRYQTLSEASPLHALVPWGLMVTGYTVFAFSSGGVFDSMAIRLVFYGDRAEARAARRLMWLALALLIPGVATVFADLLHVEHSLWIYLGFNPSSRMAWNGVLYVLYAVFLLAALLYAVRRGEEALLTGTGKALLVCGLVSSLALEYNLAMVYGVNAAVPGWFAAPMGILGVALAFLLGAAWTVIGLGVEGEEEARRAAAREMALAAAATGFLALWVLLQTWSWGLAKPAEELLVTGSLAPVFWAAVVLGVAVPLLAGYPVSRRGRAAGAVVAAATVIGGLLLFHSIVAAGQVARLEALEPYNTLSIHALGAGYASDAVHELLASPAELLAVIGEFGLWMLLYAAGLALLALRPGEKPRRLLVFR